jgi:kynureninase
MKEYKDWLLFLNKKQKFQSIKILDLALEVINTIDPIQVRDKLLILNSILNNFVLAEKMSKIFTEKIN